jgi:hypothetical protein
MRAKVTARRRHYTAVRARLLSVLRVTWHAVLELLRHSAEALEGDGRLLLRGGHANARSGRGAAECRRKLQRGKRRAVAHERQREQQHAGMRHCSTLGRRERGPPVDGQTKETNGSGEIRSFYWLACLP